MMGSGVRVPSPAPLSSPEKVDPPDAPLRGGFVVCGPAPPHRRDDAGGGVSETVKARDGNADLTSRAAAHQARKSMAGQACHAFRIAPGLSARPQGLFKRVRVRLPQPQAVLPLGPALDRARDARLVGRRHADRLDDRLRPLVSEELV
jgi:hypothetical protein